MARGKFRWRHIHAVIPRNENASFSSSLWTQNLKGAKTKAKMLRFYPYSDIQKKDGRKKRGPRVLQLEFTVYTNFQIKYRGRAAEKT